GEAPAEPEPSTASRLGRSLALPAGVRLSASHRLQPSPLPVGGRAGLETQEDIAELDAVAVLKLDRLRQRPIVDQRLVGGCAIVDEHVLLLGALDVAVLLLDLHIAEERDVGVLLAAQKAGRLLQRILAPFLPAAQDAYARRLKHRLNEGRQ